ncbi:5-formyltetrahydrofolate cyclo-ligase family protein [Candidatus Rubidus massiliensis]|nr:5-formyltetrahydrofolate cyclo-ligase family protein [Candidatus Rubidus massiliensis]
MENLRLKTKQELRNHWKKIRASISCKRKKEAAYALTELKNTFQNGLVLSYVSFATELNTYYINQILLKKKILCLPKIVSQELAFYQITNYDQLKLNSFGILEPDEKLSKPITCEQITDVIVPGLCFDPLHHRLGYGKGFYDKTLQKWNHTFVTHGCGFFEQFSSLHLPVNNFDYPLNNVFLF